LTVSLQAALEAASGFVWGPWLLIPLLVAVGVFLTVRLGGLQFRELGTALRLAFVDRKEAGAEGDISHFQALMTALAATVGTGNIAGVATAIAAGGPGALFWMWCTGVLGMATKYAEALLSVHFREVDASGHMSGGPMYFLSRGVGGRLGRGLGAAFALFAAIAAFGIGNGVQSQEVANALEASFGLPPLWTTGVLAGLVGLVLLGGIRSIGRLAGTLVPTMIALYLVAGLYAIAANAEYIGPALAAVMRGAFSESAFGGGLLGASVAAAIRFGFARGIFSNESGLGSAGIAAAAASTREPARQALVSMTQTFIDTLIVCSVTGLAILTAVLADADPNAWRDLSGAAWTTRAFALSLPAGLGAPIVSLALALFAFSTVLGWSYYGEKSVQYLAGDRMVVPYRVVFAAMVFIGPAVFDQSIWLLSDLTNGLMALPNLIGLVLLSPIVVRETRAYLQRRAAAGGSGGAG